ncbi:hypothetical protein DFH09DRAFT_457170 [Mycena vulgaris]|nr:hypothetical protein DFH09DRAFT_457170 [Mycena vulgaris]
MPLIAPARLASPKMPPSSQGSPRRIRSGDPWTLHTPAPRIQEDLMPSATDEIGAQTWQVEPEEISRLLSPKRIKDDRRSPTTNSFHSLDDYNTVIDEPIFHLPPPPPSPIFVPSESANYAPICAFFNHALANCRAPRNAVYQHDSAHAFGLRNAVSWLENLSFRQYARDTGDGIDDAAPLELAIIGTQVSRWATTFTAYWAHPKPQDTQIPDKVGVDIPVEVTDDWAALCRRATTYARAMSAAVPLRSFSLVLGVNHTTKELRFLIFHPGGLTSHRPLSFEQDEDRATMQRIFFAISLWQTPEHAGYPHFTDGSSIMLPSSKMADKTIRMWIEELMYHAVTVRGRNTAVYLLRPSPPMHESVRPKHVPTRLKFNAVSDGAIGRRERAPQSNSNAGSQSSPITAKILPLKYHEHEISMTPPKFYHGGGLDDTPDTPLVLKMCWTPQGTRERECEIYCKIQNGFGTPRLRCAFEVTAQSGAVSSNALLCGASAAFCPLLGDGSGEAEEESGERERDVRSLWGYVFEDRGDTLETCGSAWELSVCVLHALLGWLTYYQHGEMHRDVSIGNVLRPRGGAVKRDAFSMRYLREALQTMADSDDGVSPGLNVVRDPKDRKHAAPEPDADDDSAGPAAERRRPASQSREKEYAHLFGLFDALERNAAALDVRDACEALLIDADMAADLGTYFDPQKHDSAPSGTPEFMSLRLLDAVEKRADIVHCPLDDFWSAFFVTMWAIVFNTHHPSPRSTPQANNAWQTALRGSPTERTKAIEQIFLAEMHDLPPLLAKMHDAMFSWKMKLSQMSKQWSRDWPSVRDGDEASKRQLFHRFACQGVLDFMDILLEHREELQTV